MKVLPKGVNSTISNPYLILWNNDNYAKLFSEKFSDVTLILSAEDLKILDFEKEDFAGAVILVELRWSNRRYSQLYGLEVVKTFLRAQKKLKFPILFVSFLSPKQILIDNEGNKRLENQIIGAVGHDFLRLPVAFQTLLNHLEELNPLNELQFSDVLNNLCNLKGLIGGRIHELQGRLRSLGNSPDKLKSQAEDIFEKSLNEIASLLKDTTGLTRRIERIKHEFREKISDANVSSKDIQEFLERCGNEISALVGEDQIGPEVIESTTEKFEKQPWKILLLDDEPDSLHALQKTLKQRGTEFLLAQTFEEAEKIITEDIYNEITIAISDYRLLEKGDDVEKHQRKQGYDFLLWLSAQDHFTHLIALSGLSRKFLLESFQKYNTRVDVYSKQDLMGERAVNLFVDNILDRGREIYEAVCSRPVVGDWKSLKPFYAAHRASTEYRLKEQEINNRASRYIKQYEELLESRDETYLLQPDLDKLSELTTKLAEKNPNDPRSMEAFYNKLVGRRIALWLHLKLGFSRNEVFAALKGQLSPANILLEIESELKDGNGTYDEKLLEKLKAKVYKKYKDNSTNLVTTNLALSFPVISSELLTEEKNWLETEIGIRNFDSPFSVARQIPYFVQIGVEQFLEISPLIIEKLRQSNKTVFTRLGKLEIVNFTDAKEIIKAIDQTASSPAEKENFQRLLKVLDKNIKASVGDNPLRSEFLDFIIKFSDSSEN